MRAGQAQGRARTARKQGRRKGKEERRKKKRRKEKEEEKKRRREKEREEKEKRSAAGFAAGGRAWATGSRAARDGTAARKKRKGLVGALKSDDRTAGELGED